MSTSVEQPRHDRPRFRDTALASGLVDDAQLHAAEEAAAALLDRSIAPPTEWDQALADSLVQSKILTPFQAREILAGRKRFRLGQYTVLDEVARGGMGQVFRAEHAMMGREVAVKVLPRAKATPESEAAFRREMRMLGRLDHENLVRAFDAGYDAMVYYLVTELVPGIDLKRQIQKTGAMDETTAASVIVQAAKGLAYAHDQGLVHRDVKPGNLLVMPDGRVKVLDLGLAGSQLEEESARLGRVVGTMDYIAPEQIRTPDDVGPSADIYALGCTLYYAVSGQVPFPDGTRREKMQRHLYEVPPSIHKLSPWLSADFCRLIESMMAKDPDHRLRSATEVVDRLRPWTPPVPLPIRPRDSGQSARGMPLPFVDETKKGSRKPSLDADQDTSPLKHRRDDDTPWAGSKEGPMDGTVAALRAGIQQLVRAAAVVRTTRALPVAIAVAAIGGAMFGGAMGIAQGINPDRFAKLMRGFGPASLGLAAFGVILVAQLIAMQSGGRRHRR
jgi:serine/threonine protein kinase